MTPKERAAYFGHLWPNACLANEWDVKDEAQRRAVTAECMRLVRGPQIESTSRLGPDEITALFVYLRHLGDSASLEKSADWVSCQEDYQTFNRARQADWHEHALYGVGKNKLDRNRFGGETTAAGSPLGTLDKKKVAQRHLTMATRHQRKQRTEKAIAALIELPEDRERVTGQTFSAGSGQRTSTRNKKGKDTHTPESEKPANAPRNSPAPSAVSGAGHSAADDVPF